MKIANFVRSMLPSFSKRRLLEDLKTIEDDLNSVTIPTYERASNTLKGKNWKPELIQDMEYQCSRRVGLYSGNHIRTIYRCLKNNLEVLKTISGVVGKDYSNDIIKEGITYLMANHIQYVEMSNFVNTYSRRYLIYVLTTEALNTAKTVDYQAKSEMMREEEYLKSSKENFIIGLGILSRSVVDIDKELDKVPDITVDQDKAAIATATVGAAKLDPLGFNLIPVPLNPIYHVRMGYAAWQVNRHLLAQEEKKQLEFKMLQLKELKDNGQSDAKLDQQIEYTATRIDKLRYKMKRMEEENE